MSGVARIVARHTQPLRGAAADFDPLIERARDARIVLLGEASHGTAEFYAARAAITRRLIGELGFSAVAVEGDWPDAARVNRFVRGLGADADAHAALGDFRRFPLWMWRNHEVAGFANWLREHNERRPLPERVGFYGLDMYSLYASIAAVIAYLEQVDPEAAEEARRRYACLDHVGGEAQYYGFAASRGLRPACEEEVVAQLTELLRGAPCYAAQDGPLAADAQFEAEQNARLVRSAELYYRAMYEGGVNTWNLRDRHMAETLEALCAHLDREGAAARVVVWAHNSHLGDASTTDMAARGEWNLGQLARERWGKETLLVGFTTYEGEVTAASEWDGPHRRRRVRPGLDGSIEALCHAAGEPRFLLDLARPELAEALREPRLERAIGVIYLPRTERASHYFRCRVAEQFDMLLHYDRTRALEPLDAVSEWERVPVAETYPFGV